MMTRPARFTISKVAVDWQEPNCGHPTACTNVQLHHGMQLANTPPLQSTTPGLHPVSIHQTAPPVRGSRHPITAYYSYLSTSKGWKAELA